MSCCVPATATLPTLYSRRIRSTYTSRCSSPIPLTITSPVAALLDTWGRGANKVLGQGIRNSGGGAGQRASGQRAGWVSGVRRGQLAALLDTWWREGQGQGQAGAGRVRGVGQRSGKVRQAGIEGVGVRVSQTESGGDLPYGRTHLVGRPQPATGRNTR